MTIIRSAILHPRESRPRRVRVDACTLHCIQWMNGMERVLLGALNWLTHKTGALSYGSYLRIIPAIAQ